VLLAERIAPAAMVPLLRHLAECRPDDVFDSIGLEDTLRHFRSVAIESEEGRTERPVQFISRRVE